MAFEDLKTLLNDLVPFAEQMLSQHGEFFPFAASMSPDGTVTQVGADTGDEHPEPQALIGFLTQVFRARAAAGEIRAAGICVDVRVVPPGQTEKTDAICVMLEDQSGEGWDAYIPYKKGFLGKYKYGDLFVVEQNPRFFVHGGAEE